MRETQGPLDIETVARTTFVNDRTQAFYVQDQIDLAPQVKVNLGYRLDDYKRDVDRVGGLPFTPQRRDQTAHSYRAGLVYAPRFDQQFYFATSTLVHAGQHRARGRVAARAEHGAQLRGGPPLAGMERPRRHDGRLLLHRPGTTSPSSSRSSASFRSASRTRRAWTWTSTPIWAARRSLVFNYGLATPKFEDAGDLDGKTPRFAPQAQRQPVAAQGLRAAASTPAFGVRYLAEQFGDNANTQLLDGYTIFSGAVGYRTPAVGVDGERREPVQQRGLLPARPLRQQRVPRSADQRHDHGSPEVELTGRSDNVRPVRAGKDRRSLPSNTNRTKQQQKKTKTTKASSKLRCYRHRGADVRLRHVDRERRAGTPGSGPGQAR